MKYDYASSRPDQNVTKRIEFLLKLSHGNRRMAHEAVSFKRRSDTRFIRSHINQSVSGIYFGCVIKNFITYLMLYHKLFHVI